MANNNYIYWREWLGYVKRGVVDNDGTRNLIRTDIYAINTLPIIAVEEICSSHDGILIKLKGGDRILIDESFKFGHLFTRDELEDLTTERTEELNYLKARYTEREVYVPDHMRDRPYNKSFPKTTLWDIIRDVEDVITGKPKDNATLEYAREYIASVIRKLGYDVNDIDVSYTTQIIPPYDEFTPIIRVDFDDKTFKNIADIL